MADLTEIVAGRRWAAWRIVMWGTAAVLLSLPWIAMQLHASGVDWGPRDFVVMGVMLGLAGGACELAARDLGQRRLSRRGGNRHRPPHRLPPRWSRFLTVWANLAVGMIGSEANPYNLLFGGVLLLALGGSVAARFRPAGMAKAMVIAALAQAALGAFGYRVRSARRCVQHALRRAVAAFGAAVSQDSVSVNL